MPSLAFTTFAIQAPLPTTREFGGQFVHQWYVPLGIGRVGHQRPGSPSLGATAQVAPTARRFRREPKEPVLHGCWERLRLTMMQKLAALLMAITGVSVSVLGILLFWVLRRSGVWGDRASRDMWLGMSGAGTTFDSSVSRTFK